MVKLVGKRAVCTDLPAIFQINKISAAPIPQNIKGTIAEQAIKVLRICVFVAGEIFAFPIGKKGIMPHRYPSRFHFFANAKRIMAQLHAFVKAGEIPLAKPNRLCYDYYNFTAWALKAYGYFGLRTGPAEQLNTKMTGAFDLILWAKG